MTEKRNKSWMASFLMIAMLGGILTALPAKADVSESVDKGHPVVAKELSSFKQTAWEVVRHADQLDAITPNRQLNWTTHLQSLDALKENVNQLGRSLASLEELKPQASEEQRMAIESARPSLVAAAAHLTQAFELLSDDRRNIYLQPYSDTVNSLYTHATSLYETVDTIMDYEKAKGRLLNLDLATSAEGS
jgi:hypothetical protein